jgi:hypothetical protein
MVQAKQFSLLLPLLMAGCATAGPTNTYPSIVQAGSSLVFHHASELRTDCSVLSVPEITVTSPPTHGKVTVYQAKLRPDGFDPRNPRYKCRSKLVDGRLVKYTPDSGFRGKDRVTIRIDFHYVEGEIRRNHSETVITNMTVE